MKNLCDTTNKGCLRFGMTTIVPMVLLLSSVVLPSLAQTKDPSSLIGSQCFNETLTIERKNESLFAAYLGFFNVNSCTLGSTVNCFINGTALGEQVVPLCSRLGGISYQQNFTGNCTPPSTQQSITGLTFTALDFSGCAAPSCNLTTFEEYNIDPTYKYSFASIAVSAFQSYGVSNCQFVVVKDVQMSSSPSTTTTTASGATSHRLPGATRWGRMSWMVVILLARLPKILS